MVSVSNHLCSDSRCLIMVCEDSRPNPLRDPHILLWGNHSPGPGGEEFFPKEIGVRLPPCLPAATGGRTSLPEVVKGCWTRKLGVDLEWRKGFIEM